jgi:hypothetical protein
MINLDIQNELLTVIGKDEKLLWTGNPRTGIVFRKTDIFFIPFSLFWFGFVCFWCFMAARGSGLFALFGIPFAIMGIYLVAGRFYLDARKRKNTIYGITNKRIIIKSGVFSREIQSFNIKALPQLILELKNDASGTISLAPSNYQMTNSTQFPFMKQQPGLEFIENAQEVYDLIVKLQE